MTYADKFRQELEEGVPSSLPLHLYTPLAAQHAADEYELAETWQSPTWEFTRLMKGHPDLSDLTASEAHTRVDWALTDFDEDEELSFLAEWDKVRYIPGWSPLDWALMMAEAKPLTPTRSSKGRFSRYARFVSLAGWLQVEMKGRNIFLPCRKIAELLGYDPKTIANMRKLAVAEGLFEIAREHDFSRRQATEFRFAVDRFSVLAERVGQTETVELQ